MLANLLGRRVGCARVGANVGVGRDLGHDVGHGILRGLDVAVWSLAAVVALMAPLAQAAQAAPRVSTVVPYAPDQGRYIPSADGFAVLPARERVAPENQMVTDRLEHLLPQLMLLPPTPHE